MIRSLCTLAVILSLGSVASAEITFSEIQQGASSTFLVLPGAITTLTPPNLNGTPLVNSDAVSDGSSSITTTIEQVGRDYVITSTFSLDRPIDVTLQEVQHVIDFELTGLGIWEFDVEFESTWSSNGLSEETTNTVVGEAIAFIEREDFFRPLNIKQAGGSADTINFSASGSLFSNHSYEMLLGVYNYLYYVDIGGVEYTSAISGEGTYTMTLIAPPVPEPSSILIFGIGTAGLIGVDFRRKRT